MLNKTKKPPGKDSGPGGRGRHTASARADSTSSIAATATSKSHDHSQGSRRHDRLMAHVLLMLAMPGALYDRAFVRTCPICGYGHIHNLMPGEARTGPIMRSPRCAPHRTYVLEITGVVPASPVPGQRRRRAAA